MSGSSPSRLSRARQALGVPAQRWPRATGIAIAAASTITVLAAVGFVVVNSSGWPLFQKAFLDADVFADRFPEILSAFMLNVRLFLTAEVLILIGGLVLAVFRGLKSPLFFPLRLASVIYIDVMRGLPSIIVIYILGLGIPTLNIEGVSKDPFVWAVVALTMVWSAYVAEVYRSGIESVHPSQNAAARSLGMSAFQSMRYVVLPQAVRRVIPPLLNDFIGLMKDTALISFIGPIEAFRRSQIAVASTFNFTPYLAAAVIFLVLTIPMARFVDWLVERSRRRQMAGSR